MRRFFIDEKAIKGDGVIIGGEEAHHIRDVIRLKVGDRFLGFDGTGRAYTLCIKKITDAIEAQIEKVSTADAKMPKILLACAVPKKNKMDYIIEKAAELGVSDIIPMITERTVVKFDDGDRQARQKRWGRISIEASKQCGRDTLPIIHSVMKFKDAITKAEDLGYKKKIMPCLCEGRKYVDEALLNEVEQVAVFIGPEGDFSNKEIGYAKGSGFELVSLGPLVLKVDTACIFTISLIHGRCLRSNV